jgi:DNA helicase-2/ATP-dependent DNA helicase PcrA
MKAEEHPEYSLEQEHLQRTLGALEGLLVSLGQKGAKRNGPDAGAALFRDHRSRGERLQLVSTSPYFGRIDFARYTPDATAPETCYIGKIGFAYNGQRVLDWEAPIAALFYSGNPGEASYETPEGQVTGTLLLKRNLDIEYQSLIIIADEFDRREPLPGTEHLNIVDPDEYLREILASKQEACLRDIVATIQAQQYDLIRSEANQVLVIQGVAGSGKTSVALHRLAFLLYPETGTGFEPQHCIIFGPNRLFINYISKVLPDLGIEGVLQTTLVDWACEQLGLTDQRFTDQALRALISPEVSRDEKVAHYRRSQLKNSQRMGQLLERYSELRRCQINFPAEGLVYPDLGEFKITVSLTSEQIEAIYHQFVDLPVQLHRRRFVETLRAELTSQYESAVAQLIKEVAEPGEKFLTWAKLMREKADELEKMAELTRQTEDAALEQQQTARSLEKGATGLRELAAYYQRQGQPIVFQAERQHDQALQAEARQAVLDQLDRQLIEDVDRCWPLLRPVPDYYALLGDLTLLTMVGQDVFTPEEIQHIHQPERLELETIDLSDLPAIHFLHTVVNGTPTELYDHIVIDEAQDVSRLQFETIRRFSRNGSFTILGDLPQSIYAHRGIASWDEIQAAFPDSNYHYAEITKSYRTTFEIAKMANTVLRSMAQAGRNILLAEPFERYGDKPAFHAVQSEADLPSAVASAVRQVQRGRYENIAVITKTTEDCQRLAEALRAAQLSQFEVALSSDFEYKGGLVLLPVHLAKAMEFEAVLVVGADDRTYTATEFDGRLLYVALTRALHVLHVFWVGKVAWHLEKSILPQTGRLPVLRAGPRA